MLRRSLLLTLPVLATVARAQPATRGLATSGDATIEYEDQGSGPAIVLVPSLGRGVADFDDLAARLAASGFRVLRPQPRGIGGSTGSLADPSLHRFAADVAAVVEQARAAPVVALGHAFGNTVARTLAADRPDLVRGVILLAASGRAPLGQDVKDAIARSSDLGLPDGERERSLAAAYFAPGHDASAWLRGWYPAAQAAQWEATRTSRLDDYIAAGGRVPILDIQADHDAIIPPRYSQDLHRELGERVTVVVIADAGHALLPEQPGPLAAAITAWMRRS